MFKGRKIILAPLAGITETVFRSICKKFGADILFSEMVSAEGLLHGSKATEELLMFEQKERPVGIQLFGANPDHMARAAEIIYKKASPDFIDINAGCPVAKVVKKNGGSGLLKDQKLFGEIVRSVAGAVPVPVTVKIRSGWERYKWVDVEFAVTAQRCGAAALTLHPRSQTMGFSGHSYWERIAEVKKVLSIPVIGNGDIVTASDALEMFRSTGCDSVMIGRGAFGNPWIFSQVKRSLEGREELAVTPEMKIETALRHIASYKEIYGEARAYREMKKHTARYVKGLPGVSAIRDRIFRAGSTDELIAVLREAERIAV